MRRKLILTLAVLLMIGGLAYATTPGYETSPGTGDILGRKGLQDEGNKIFRMVRNVLDTPLTADDIVIWNLTEDDGITVGVSTTSGDSAVAGILASAILERDSGSSNTAAQDRGNRNWGWLQTYGLAQVDVAATVEAAGMAMGTSTTGTEARPVCWSGAGVATGGAATQGKAGFFYDAASSGDDNVQCFVILD